MALGSYAAFLRAEVCAFEVSTCSKTILLEFCFGWQSASCMTLSAELGVYTQLLSVQRSTNVWATV